MLSLKEQLSNLKSNNNKESKRALLPKSATATLLFPFNSTSKKINSEVAYSLGLQGIIMLSKKNYDCFSYFFDNLFISTAKYYNRDLINEKESEVIDENVKKLVILLSNYFEDPSCHKVIEFLIRIYDVHIYNKEVLILSFLPFYYNKYYIKLIQNTNFEDENYHGGLFGEYFKQIALKGLKINKEEMFIYIYKDENLLYKIVNFYLEYYLKNTNNITFNYYTTFVFDLYFSICNNSNLNLDSIFNYDKNANARIGINLISSVFTHISRIFTFNSYNDNYNVLSRFCDNVYCFIRKFNLSKTYICAIINNFINLLNMSELDNFLDSNFNDNELYSMNLTDNKNSIENTLSKAKIKIIKTIAILIVSFLDNISDYSNYVKLNNNDIKLFIDLNINELVKVSNEIDLKKLIEVIMHNYISNLKDNNEQTSELEELYNSVSHMLKSLNLIENSVYSILEYMDNYSYKPNNTKYLIKILKDIYAFVSDVYSEEYSNYILKKYSNINNNNFNNKHSLINNSSIHDSNVHIKEIIYMINELNNYLSLDLKILDNFDMLERSINKVNSLDSNYLVYEHDKEKSNYYLLLLTKCIINIIDILSKSIIKNNRIKVVKILESIMNIKHINCFVSFKIGYEFIDKITILIQNLFIKEIQIKDVTSNESLNLLSILINKFITSLFIYKENTNTYISFNQKIRIINLFIIIQIYNESQFNDISEYKQFIDIDIKSKNNLYIESISIDNNININLIKDASLFIKEFIIDNINKHKENTEAFPIKESIINNMIDFVENVFYSNKKINYYNKTIDNIIENNNNLLSKLIEYELNIFDINNNESIFVNFILLDNFVIESKIPNQNLIISKIYNKLINQPYNLNSMHFIYINIFNTIKIDYNIAILEYYLYLIFNALKIIINNFDQVNNKFQLIIMYLVLYLNDNNNKFINLIKKTKLIQKYINDKNNKYNIIFCLVLNITNICNNEFYLSNYSLTNLLNLDLDNILNITLQKDNKFNINEITIKNIINIITNIDFSKNNSDNSICEYYNIKFLNFITSKIKHEFLNNNYIEYTNLNVLINEEINIEFYVQNINKIIYSCNNPNELKALFDLISNYYNLLTMLMINCLENVKNKNELIKTHNKCKDFIKSITELNNNNNKYLNVFLINLNKLFTMLDKDTKKTYYYSFIKFNINKSNVINNLIDLENNNSQYYNKIDLSTILNDYKQDTDNYNNNNNFKSKLIYTVLELNSELNKDNYFAVLDILRDYLSRSNDNNNNNLKIITTICSNLYKCESISYSDQEYTTILTEIIFNYIDTYINNDKKDNLYDIEDSYEAVNNIVILIKEIINYNLYSDIFVLESFDKVISKVISELILNYDTVKENKDNYNKNNINLLFDTRINIILNIISDLIDKLTNVGSTNDDKYKNNLESLLKSLIFNFFNNLNFSISNAIFLNNIIIKLINKIIQYDLNEYEENNNSNFLIVFFLVNINIINKFKSYNYNINNNNSNDNFDYSVSNYICNTFFSNLNNNNLNNFEYLNKIYNKGLEGVKLIYNYKLSIMSCLFELSSKSNLLRNTFIYYAMCSNFNESKDSLNIYCKLYTYEFGYNVFKSLEKQMMSLRVSTKSQTNKMVKLLYSIKLINNNINNYDFDLSSDNKNNKTTALDNKTLNCSNKMLIKNSYFIEEYIIESLHSKGILENIISNILYYKADNIIEDIIVDIENTNILSEIVVYLSTKYLNLIITDEEIKISSCDNKLDLLKNILKYIVKDISNKTIQNVISNEIDCLKLHMNDISDNLLINQTLIVILTKLLEDNKEIYVCFKDNYKFFINLIEYLNIDNIINNKFITNNIKSSLLYLKVSIYILLMKVHTIFPDSLLSYFNKFFNINFVNDLFTINNSNNSNLIYVDDVNKLILEALKELTSTNSANMNNIINVLIPKLILLTTYDSSFYNSSFKISSNIKDIIKNISSKCLFSNCFDSIKICLKSTEDLNEYYNNHTYNAINNKYNLINTFNYSKEEIKLIIINRLFLIIFMLERICISMDKINTESYYEKLSKTIIKICLLLNSEVNEECSDIKTKEAMLIQLLSIVIIFVKKVNKSQLNNIIKLLIEFGFSNFNEDVDSDTNQITDKNNILYASTSLTIINTIADTLKQFFVPYLNQYKKGLMLILNKYYVYVNSIDNSTDILNIKNNTSIFKKSKNKNHNESSSKSNRINNSNALINTNIIYKVNFKNLLLLNSLILNNIRIVYLNNDNQINNSDEISIDCTNNIIDSIITQFNIISILEKHYNYNGNNDFINSISTVSIANNNNTFYFSYYKLYLEPVIINIFSTTNDVDTLNSFNDKILSLAKEDNYIVKLLLLEAIKNIFIIIDVRYLPFIDETKEVVNELIEDENEKVASEALKLGKLFKEKAKENIVNNEEDYNNDEEENSQEEIV